MRCRNCGFESDDDTLFKLAGDRLFCIWCADRNLYTRIERMNIQDNE